MGELKAGNVVKTQFGSSQITRARESGEIISLADDLKAAATDALKKAATLLGVGLHLYGGNNGRAQNSNSGQYQGKPSATGGKANGTYKPGNGNRNGNGNGRLSAKQYRYMLKLNEEHGRTKADLDQQCLEMFGTVAQHLSKADASSVIEHLLAN